jgi:hypothetical protein
MTLLGRNMTIWGKAVIMKTPDNRMKKNGMAAHAMEKMLLPVKFCNTKRLNPTGGVICAISAVITRNIPNQTRLICIVSRIG